DSHSHLHRRVFAGQRLLALIRAEDDFSPSDAVHSPYLSCRESPLELDADDFVGLPLLPVRGFLEDGAAVRLPIAAARELQAAARELLASTEGRLGPGACARLRDGVTVYALQENDGERMQAEMREDLALARACLREQRGDSSAGRTVCVPFTLG